MYFHYISVKGREVIVIYLPYKKHIFTIVRRAIFKMGDPINFVILDALDASKFLYLNYICGR